MHLAGSSSGGGGSGSSRRNLIFLGLVEEILFTLIGNHFGPITKKDDTARGDAEPTGSVHVHLIVVRVFVELSPDTRATEFSCRPIKSVGIGGRGFLERLAVLGRCTRAVTVGNPLRNLVVPFFLGPAVQEANNNHGHVVTPNSTGFTTRSETVVHHILTDAMKILLSGDPPPDKFDHRLRSLTIPDTCKERLEIREKKSGEVETNGNKTREAERRVN